MTRAHLQRHLSEQHSRSKLLLADLPPRVVVHGEDEVLEVARPWSDRWRGLDHLGITHGATLGAMWDATPSELQRWTATHIKAMVCRATHSCFRHEAEVLLPGVNELRRGFRRRQRGRTFGVPRLVCVMSGSAGRLWGCWSRRSRCW